MMKRMLINAAQPEECRVAIVDGQHLEDLDIEVAAHSQMRASIYKARITRVEPSLEAAFVDFGVDRHGFLPFKEVAQEFFADKGENSDGRPNIREALREGQELIVQVEKEERGNKGAALTTFPSLAGRYLVLMPNNPRAGGISRRVEGDERSALREALSTLDVPTGMGLIVRTAGVGKSAEDLQWDLDYLVNLWRAIETAAAAGAAPRLLYRESGIIIRAIRDYFRQDVAEILVDNETVYAEAQEFIQNVMPHNLPRLKLWKGEVPLFSRFQIESQIESAFANSVRLPSGGSIVVDQTEALVAIDVNSARATKGADIEETALNTNLEAADEVARQLRLRDVGGLIVIDFIDMTPSRNQRAVETRLRDALQIDRARVQVGRISRFGLLEMSRQRLRPSLGESSSVVCPTCTGRGQVRGVESLALSVLRIIQEESMKHTTGQVLVKLPVGVATFLLNEKREALNKLEKNHHIRLIVVPDPGMVGGRYEVQRIRDDDTDHESVHRPSYELATTVDSTEEYLEAATREAPVEAAVRAIPRTRAPSTTDTATVPPPDREGIITRLWRQLFGRGEGGEAPGTDTRVTSAAKGGRGQDGRGRSRGADRRRGSRQRRGGGAQRTDGVSEARQARPGRTKAERSENPRGENRDRGAPPAAPRPEGERKDRGSRTADGGRSGSERSNQRRSRRGGRGRGRRSPDATSTPANGRSDGAQSNTASEREPAAAPTPASVPRTVDQDAATEIGRRRGRPRSGGDPRAARHPDESPASAGRSPQPPAAPLRPEAERRGETESTPRPSAAPAKTAEPKPAAEPDSARPVAKEEV